MTARTLKKVILKFLALLIFLGQRYVTLLHDLRRPRTLEFLMLYGSFI